MKDIRIIPGIVIVVAVVLLCLSPIKSWIVNVMNLISDKIRPFAEKWPEVTIIICILTLLLVALLLGLVVMVLNRRDNSAGGN